MSDPESISSGRSLPQWMKGKPDARYDFDSAAFSPPAHDDSFFYIRYPIVEAEKNERKSNLKSLTDALNDLEVKPSTSTVKLPKYHTEPCKMFLDSSNDSAAPSPAFANVKNPTKPFGTDDGFKGAGAACGSSIVKVARQMVSGKSLARGFTVANFNNDTEQQPEEKKPVIDIDLMYHSRYTLRRGSKSLPASPVGSPKSMRKAQPNPYFTAQFTVANTNATENQRGWFLSSLLGVQREATSTTSVVSNISEEAEESIHVPAKNIPNLNSRVLKAKPSELREMNFWSPTSM